MFKLLLVTASLLTKAWSSGRTCNYRIDTDVGGMYISAMGCDPRHNQFYQCVNSTHVSISNFTQPSCSGNMTGVITLPAGMANANCTDNLDCHVTELDYRDNTTCNGHSSPIVQYTGGLCQPSMTLFGVNRSIMTTCDTYKFIKYDFAHMSCDPAQLATEERYNLDACLVPMNGTAIQKSMSYHCVNPQSNFLPLDPANPVLYETTFFSDAACRSITPVSKLLKYKPSLKCVYDSIFNISSDMSCNNQSTKGETNDWTNFYAGNGCNQKLLIHRQGGPSGICTDGVETVCQTFFGPKFSSNMLTINNYMNGNCGRMVIDVPQVDEYKLDHCIGFVEFKCNPNNNGTIIRQQCGDPTTAIAYELNKCIENPDANGRVAVPYIMVESTAGCGVGPLTPIGNKTDDSAAPIAIGITLGIIILLGVGCIYYRRAKLKSEEQTLQLLTNDTEK